MEGREGMGWGGERRGRGPGLLRTAAEGATVPFQGCKGTVGRMSYDDLIAAPICQEFDRRTDRAQKDADE